MATIVNSFLFYQISCRIRCIASDADAANITVIYIYMCEK
jgi:hypothetical protein